MVAEWLKPLLDWLGVSLPCLLLGIIALILVLKD